ncbi:nuclear pore complex protein Nup214 [Armigeres subalbatus]|uniref:nuclear pore complex protein Nup214 n=1 Tax=Armigeres subalbatus TaxID=124917 RepID=UPI002ED5EFEC
MAVPAPTGLDVTELKFTLQNKVPIFNGDGNVKDSCSLLAAASVHGLIFAGTTGPQLKVLQLKDITPDKVIDEVVPLRTVPLPSEPLQLAISSDHGFLAVDVVNGGVPIIQIYSVPSFLTPSIVKLHEIRTSPEGGVRSTQILWNPVIHNMFSVRTANGALSMYTLKEPSGIEFHSLDKSEGAICACWSPKGKQLVVGFANGKLMQYKPDLKPARTIACPPGVMEGPFDVIAVQWLSTYQFAAVYLPHAEDSVPSLFIVNAPKAGNPTFVNYDDICYSQSGPRRGQVFLIHILQWNLLLMASANSMEVGILGTTESGETPTWSQWTTTDEARAELPLSSDKQETLPIGFSLETGCTHEITISEQTIPVMPMIHLLSTYGLLVSFNVLNLVPNIPKICSPPRPVTDTSGKFEISTSKQPTIPVVPPAQPSAEITFTVPTGATSTPAIAKTKSFFNPSENKSPVNLFGVPSAGSAAAAAPAAVAPTFGKQITFGSIAAPSTETAKTSPFGGGSSVSSFGIPSKPFAPTTTTTATVQPSQPSLLKTALGQHQLAPQQQQQKTASDASKPFITVPPTYTPPPPVEASRSNSMESISKPSQKQLQRKQESTEDTNSIIRAMISEEIRKFEKELIDLKMRCTDLNTTIGFKEESTTIIKDLKELQDLSIQAAESTESLTSDVQALRLGLNEAFAMVAEANSKNAIYKHPSPNQFQETHAMSQSSRRQLASLQNMLAVNENQLHIVNKQIDAQWSAIQEANRNNSRRRMHVPSLEVLYQTLTKQQEILNRQKEKLSYIKTKVGMRESIRGLEKDRKKNLTTVDNVDSLTDSIVSMSIVDQVREDARRLSEAKMSSFRNMLKNRMVVTIKPRRPDRIGLNSEVVRERRNDVRRINSERMKVEPTVITKPVAPTKKVEEKAEVQPKVTQPVVVIAPTKPAVKEPTKVLDLPKATGAPNFGVKPTVVTVQNTTKTTPFGFASTSQTSTTPAVTKPTPTMFGVPATATSSSVFSFGQTTVQPIEQTLASKDVPITKETTLFGNTTIKPITAASTTFIKDKENQEPTSKPAVFGFGSTTIQAVAKSDSVPSADPTKSVLTFGAASNSKPSFSFGSSTGGPIPFGTSQATAPMLNLTKEKDPEPKKDDKPKEEVKKIDSLPSSSAGTSSSEEGTKTSFPALTNLLKKVDSTTGDTSKPQSIFGTTTKTTASTIFGNSTATIAPGTGLFGSIKPTSTTTITSTPSSGPFSSFNVGSVSSTEAVTTTTVLTTTNTATTTVTESTSSVPSTTSGLFGSVKPTVTTSAGTGFSFGGAEGNGFSFAAASNKPTDLSTKSEPSTSEENPIFGTVNQATTAPTSLITTTTSSTPAVTPTPAKVVTTTATATNSSTISFGILALTSSTTTTASTTAPTSTTDSTNLFGSLNICSSTTQATDKPAGNIFGSGSFTTSKTETASIFGDSASGATSAFGTATATTETSKPTSIFGSSAAVVTGASSTAGTGLFGSVATNSAASGGSIFGTTGATSSPFGSTSGGTGLFGSVAPSSPPSSTGSIFGGSTAGTQQPSSPFGAAVAPATTASSIFGSTGATSGGGLFGSVTSPSAAGGSIFGGGSAFGSTTATTNTSSGNIFGGGASTGGFGASTFGQPSSPQSGQSIFGGTASNTSGFGSNSFGSPSPSGGAFSTPTAGSVTQSGFGSPGSSAFNKPAFGGTSAFGGTPSFGGTPAFGGSAVFGGSPSFGSKPMFGGSSGFGQPPLSPSNQSNNLFEQLGSSSSGVSFGNLAQQQAEKPPQFGGSSFSSWR